MICPRCKEDRAHRTERMGAVDNAANWIFLKPYSCRGCRHRFYARRPDFNLLALRMEMGERIAKANTNRKWKRKKREMLIYGCAGLVVVAMIYMLAQQRG
jgi:type II secretory ATPase GspE/PulE/Tfp pilus assembly ATPase PilB-like protein